MSKVWDSRYTPELAATICDRSAAGEGVMAIIRDLGMPEDTLDWLAENHRGSVEAAKKQQIRARQEAALEAEKAKKDKG